MDKQNYTQASMDYYRIAKALDYIDDQFLIHPDLERIAKEVHLSKFHFQRLFKRWVGISPTQFMQFLTLEYTKSILAKSRSLLDVSYSAGLSGPGRLHDLFVTFEAITPGEYKKLGADLKIWWGHHDTPFGTCLIGVTERGICHLEFQADSSHDITYLKNKWPRSLLINDQDKTFNHISTVFQNRSDGFSQPFHLHIKGTNFQVNVWKALLNIPSGQLLSYQDIAVMCGKPTASRAVAQAVSRNPVAYLIPCHRVINSQGGIHGYRWGVDRKKAILGWEASRV